MLILIWWIYIQITRMEILMELKLICSIQIYTDTVLINASILSIKAICTAANDKWQSPKRVKGKSYYRRSYANVFFT